ncbi:MAG: D-alanyl-D-alanine carboxypeptidase/D-alanyl-D-alanine-endopeptidase [Pseudomonadota bacterium]
MTNRGFILAAATQLGLAAAAVVCAAVLADRAQAASNDLPPSLIRTLDRFDLGRDGLSVFVVDVATGQPVIDYASDVPRNPASTMKLVTTYASLDALTPGHTWETEVFALGEIDADGVLQGDLGLRGGGDPYLVESVLWQLLTELRRRGVNHIAGDIVIDNSRFELEPEDPGAFDGEPLRAYNVGPDAMLVNFKVVQFWFEPVPESRVVRITSLPELPNLEVVNDIELVRGRCRGYLRGIEIDAETDGDRVRFHGRFPDGCRRYSLGRSLLTHEDYAYGLIRQSWERLGGTISGGVRQAPIDTEVEPLMNWPSRPYGEVIRLINKHSNNVMTRQVFLTLGAHYFGEPASPDKAREAVGQWLDDRGLEFPGFYIDNGSGLSRDSRITARSLAALLGHAWRSPFMPEFLSSLSLAGTDGTFRRRLRRGPLTGRAHLKTGRLDDVSAMAGYLMANDGRRYIVVTLHNARGVHRGGGEAVQDALLRWLYAYTPREPGPVMTQVPEDSADAMTGSD